MGIIYAIILAVLTGALILAHDITLEQAYIGVAVFLAAQYTVAELNGRR